MIEIGIFGIMNVVCAVFGAIIFIFSIKSVIEIINMFPEAKMTQNWKIIQILIYFFLLGYSVNIIAVFLGLTEVLLFMQAFVYLFGAVFVYMVVSLSRKTYSIILESSKDN